MRTLLIVTAMMLAGVAHAQRIGEWTNQKQTQKKYLLQQIAALKTYLGYAAKGYTMARQGLNTIGQIKKGDVQLHETFFSSLSQVNPHIAFSMEVAAILSRQVQLAKQARRMLQDIKADDRFTSEEIDMADQTMKTLLRSGVAVVDQLADLLSSSRWQMADDERLERIHALYRETEEAYAFCVSLSKKFWAAAPATHQRTSGN